MLSAKEHLGEAYLIAYLILLRQQKNIVEKKNTFLKSVFESERLRF